MPSMNCYTPKPDLVGDVLLKRVESLKKHHGSYDDYQMAAALGFPLEIYRARIAIAESEHLRKLERWEDKIGTPLTLAGDAMVIGDLHAPLLDIQFTALVSLVAAKHLSSPRRLIIGGDLFDLESFSSWKKLTRGPEWEDEQAAISNLMIEWDKVFDEIILLTGNHELRIARATEGYFSIKELADIVHVPLVKTQYSKFGYCFLNSNDVPWIIIHPAEYSAVNQLGILDNYAQKYECNVIGFHAHQLNMDWDKWGRYIIINGGHLCKPEAVGYKTLVANKKPNWKSGFVMVRDGTPTLFGKSPLTRWADWL